MNLEKLLDQQRELNKIYTSYKVVQFRTIDYIQNVSFSNEKMRDYHRQKFKKIEKHLLKYENNIKMFKKYNNRY